MLVIEDISFSYDESQIIEQMNYSFPATGMIGITGKSGCGKTTLLYLIAGLLSPQEGQITYRGKRIDHRFLKEHISFILQNHDLQNALNVRENIKLACRINNLKIDKNEFKKIVDRLEISHLLKKYPYELSIGQRKRVSIARALLKKSAIILCDEPTGALHEKQCHEVMSLLKELSQHSLVIIVSHSSSLLKKYCQTLVEMKEGKLIGEKMRESGHEIIRSIHSSQSFFPIILKEVIHDYRHIISLIFFQCLILISFFLMNAGLEGVQQAIDDNFSSHPLKNISQIERKDGKFFSFSQGRAAFNSLSIIADAKIFILPENTNHIKLSKGKIRNEADCCVVSAAYYKKHPVNILKIEIDKPIYLKVTGVLKASFFSKEEIYLTPSFTKNYPQYYSQSVYEVEGNYWDVKRQYRDYIINNDAENEKESYLNLIKIGKMIAGIFMTVSLAVSILLLMIVFTDRYIRHLHSYALYLSLGVSKIKLRMMHVLENMVIGIIIIGLSLVISIVSIYSINILSPLYGYYHFYLKSPNILFVLTVVIYLCVLAFISFVQFKSLTDDHAVRLLREED